MTFDQLEILEKIVAAGTFKGGAKALHRTQPTVSVAIKKLEQEFGFQLFSREEYRPKLTPEGQLFYKRAMESLSSFRRLSVVAQELGAKTAEPSLTIVIDPVASFGALSMLLQSCLGFTATAATELTLRSEILCVGAELLRTGEVDFAIAIKDPLDQADDIESLPLEKIAMVPVAAAQLLGRRTKISRSWLEEHTQIIVKSSRGESLGVLPTGKQCFVTDHHLKRQLILAGFGWGRLAQPEIAAELATKSLREISADAAKPFELEMHVMRKKYRPLGPVGRSVWEILQRAAHLNTTGGALV